MSDMNQSASLGRPQSKNNLKRQVSFNDRVKVCLVQKVTKKEAEHYWLTKSDQSTIQRDLVNDVRHLRSLLSSPSKQRQRPGEIPPSHRGVEKLLSKELRTKLKIEREQHIDAILDAQEDHQSFGIDGTNQASEEIANISRFFTKRASERALTYAATDAVAVLRASKKYSASAKQSYRKKSLQQLYRTQAGAA